MKLLTPGLYRKNCTKLSEIKFSLTTSSDVRPFWAYLNRFNHMKENRTALVAADIYM